MNTYTNRIKNTRRNTSKQSKRSGPSRARNDNTHAVSNNLAMITH